MTAPAGNSSDQPRRGAKRALDPIAPGAVLAGSQGLRGFLVAKKHGRGDVSAARQNGAGAALETNQTPPAPFCLAKLPPDAILGDENPCGTPGTLGGGERDDGIVGSKDAIARQRDSLGEACLAMRVSQG
ncbi:hypothetical protein SJA_C1-18140 [Sphingobium indicum UT26S]|uniref:Uncharacterized protein n=1 Tax=Sphingobium indicum (strain DSM 16413 / CCM 7287 / MTCC 6362 / UT26 / NBRC 101211 / UT26S) TaxID=452662 RepID=D4Z216_SPHIU|nr:hypothetical protein SJA_C1-18140 [Sphingobium indicum UT26S]